MRELDIGSKKYTVVKMVDEPGQGGACHEYRIDRADEPSGPEPEFGYVKFQNGPIKETGVNGCQQEDLIAICIDRLRSFQAGDFNCRENALALTKLQEALHWLKHRTQDRIKRGVEGTKAL